MKKKYYLAITIFLLIVGCLAIVTNQDKPTYHKITNPKLIKLISDYIDDGKGTPDDKNAPFIIVNHIVGYKPDGYVFTIGYCHEESLLWLENSPLIICEPINGKRIIFNTKMYKDFVVNDYTSIGNYIEDKKSKFYRYFL